MLKLLKLVFLFYSITKLTNGSLWFGKEFDNYLEAYENNYNDDISPMLKALAIYKRKLQLLGLYPIVRTTGLAYIQSDYDVFDIEDEYDDYIYGLLNQPKLTPRYRNGYQPNPNRKPTLPPTKSPPTRRLRKKPQRKSTEHSVLKVVTTPSPPLPSYSIVPLFTTAAPPSPPPPTPPPPPVHTIQNNWVVIMPNGQPYNSQNAQRNPTGNGILCERNNGNPCTTEPNEIFQVDKDDLIQNPSVPGRNRTTTTTTTTTTTPTTTTTRRTTTPTTTQTTSTTTTKPPTTTTEHPYKFNTTHYLPLKTMPTKKISNFDLNGKDSVRPSYLSTNRPYTSAIYKDPAKLPIDSSNISGGPNELAQNKSVTSTGNDAQSFYVSSKPTVIQQKPHTTTTTTVKYDTTTHYTLPPQPTTTTEYPHTTTPSHIIATLVNLFIPEKITTKKPIIHHKPSYLSTQAPYVTVHHPNEPNNHHHTQSPTVTVTKVPEKVIVQIELDHVDDSNNVTELELPNNDAVVQNSTKTIGLLMGILGGRHPKPPPPPPPVPSTVEHHIEENIYVELPPQTVIYSQGSSSHWAKSNISNEKSIIPSSPSLSGITITPLNIEILERNAKATTENSEIIIDHKSYATPVTTITIPTTKTTEYPTTTEYHTPTKHPISSTTSHYHQTSYSTQPTLPPTILPPIKPIIIKPTLVPIPYPPLKPLLPSTIIPTQSTPPSTVSKPITDYPVMTVTISINHEKVPPFREPVGTKVTTNASVYTEKYTESYKNSGITEIYSDSSSSSTTKSVTSSSSTVSSTDHGILSTTTTDIPTTTGLYEWDIDPKMNNDLILITEEESRTVNPNLYIEETRPRKNHENYDIKNIVEESYIVTTHEPLSQLKENHENKDEPLEEAQLNEENGVKTEGNSVKSKDNTDDNEVKIQRRRSDITVYDDDDDDMFFNDDLLIDPIAQMNNETSNEILMKFKEFDIIVEQLREKHVTNEEKELLKQIVGNELWQLILNEVKRVNDQK